MSGRPWPRPEDDSWTRSHNALRLDMQDTLEVLQSLSTVQAQGTCPLITRLTDIVRWLPFVMKFGPRDFLRLLEVLGCWVHDVLLLFV